MVAVHDGTANINKRNVINVKCVNCVHCVGFDEINQYYVCNIAGFLEMIEECIANDDGMGCDMYEQDCDDDFTARS